MVKRVIWIDDDESAMKDIVQNIFPKLWDKDISSEIYIMGSYAPSVLNYKHDENSIKNVNRAVYEMFINYLINTNRINQEDEIKKKLSLLGIDKIEDDILKEVRVASNKDDLICQEANDLTTNAPLLNARKTAENIIDAMQRDTKSHDQIYTVIMLDLVLLEHDFEKLQKDYDSKGSVEIVLSMELYKELLDLLSNPSSQASVMLYSTFVIPNDVINNWIKGYSSIAGESPNPVVYNRKGIPANNGNEKNLIDKIYSFGGKKND